MADLADIIEDIRTSTTLTLEEKITKLNKIKDNIYNEVYKDVSKKKPVVDFESHFHAHLSGQFACWELGSIISELEKKDSNAKQ